MEINKNENEIVIRISKDNYLYSKLAEYDDIKQFVGYVFDLQETVNGIDSGEQACFQPIDEYKEAMKKFDKERIEKEKDICMDTIAGCISEILMASSVDYSYSFINPDGLISIDYTDNLNMMGLFYERLIHLVEQQRDLEKNVTEKEGK